MRQPHQKTNALQSNHIEKQLEILESRYLCAAFAATATQM